MIFNNGFFIYIKVMGRHVYERFPAHVMMSRIDKKNPRRKCGEFEINDLKEVAAKIDGYDRGIKKALLLLKLFLFAL